MVFELFDVGIVMAAAMIIVAGLFFAARRVGDEIWILTGVIKNRPVAAAEKPQDQRKAEYQKGVEELRIKFPEFSGLTPVDPTKPN